MKFSINDFFSKRDQIRRKLRIWSHLLKKSLWKTLFLCSVLKTTVNDRCIGYLSIATGFQKISTYFSCVCLHLNLPLLVAKIEQAVPGDVKPVVKASKQLILSNLKTLQIAILLARVTPANYILKFLKQLFFKTYIFSYSGSTSQWLHVKFKVSKGFIVYNISVNKRSNYGFNQLFLGNWYNIKRNSKATFFQSPGKKETTNHNSTHKIYSLWLRILRKEKVTLLISSGRKLNTLKRCW